MPASTLSAPPSSAPRSKIPFVDLDRQHAPLREELRRAFDRVLTASGFILGEEVERFEDEYATYCQVDHCVGVASGTAALTIALLAAGIGPGDEVIVPAHTYIASALAIVHAGATPVFCDVEEPTGLMDADSAATLVNERTAALLPVHLYGQALDVDSLGSLGRRHGLFVLEDAAQAHGARCRGVRTGALGDAAGFSFYPSKNLGALGDGGAICTNDAGIAERARQLRNLGQRGKGEHVSTGFNERLDGVQAALLRVKLPHLDQWNDARRAVAETYRQLLGDRACLLPDIPGRTCVYHLFPVRVPRRDDVARRLAQEGIQTGIHYSPAVHQQPLFAGHPTRYELRRAEAWAAEELSLPMWPGLDTTSLSRVVGVW
jgi:dTDP-4-amino-4,6-dideoxygalactose transaminase